MNYWPNNRPKTPLTWTELYNECYRLSLAIRAIAEERNAFGGPSLDYMQGYRDGQKYLQDKLAKLLS